MILLFKKLAELSDSGIKIYFFVGNHDYWTRDYFTKEIGMEVIKKPTEFKINNKLFFIGHGDGLGPGDFKYKFLKRIFRNPLFIFLFRINYPWFGIPLGNFFSRKNKILSGNNIKFKSKEGNSFAHTINGSGLAVGRCLIALIENNFDGKDTINIPNCLEQYFGSNEIKIS